MAVQRKITRTMDAFLRFYHLPVYAKYVFRVFITPKTNNQTTTATKYENKRYEKHRETVMRWKPPKIIVSKNYA